MCLSCVTPPGHLVHHRHVRQSVIVKIISNVPDKMSSRPSVLRRTFEPLSDIFPFMTGKYQWSFLFSLSDMLCILIPAGQDLSSRPDISRSLLDMSGIFCDHWTIWHCTGHDYPNNIRQMDFHALQC